MGRKPGLSAWMLVATMAAAAKAAAPASAPAVVGPAISPAISSTLQARPESTAAVEQAVRDLSHPSPARRREAFRLLSDWGPLAYHELGKAAAGGDLEASLAAGDLLAGLGEVLFIGGRVRLSVQPERLNWDEPLTLSIEIHNPSQAAVFVPGPPPQAARADQPGASAAPDEDAAQVGAMMDIVDFLEVTGPDGQPVELRVDPIDDDLAVNNAVRRRAARDAPVHALAPGATERRVIPRFNRGWARYPLLKGGRYTLRFVHEPEWVTQEGRTRSLAVKSDPVHVQVEQAAPPALIAARRPLEMTLRHSGAEWVAELWSTWDRDLWVNANIGGALDTHARLAWSIQVDDRDDAGPFELEKSATGAQFAVERLVRLTPGAGTVIARVSPADLHARIPADLRDRPLSLRYSHAASCQSLRRTLREKNRRDVIPAQLFQGSVQCETRPE